MKCPQCGLIIEDENDQVYHIERCHPNLLERRWVDAGLGHMEIALNFSRIADQHVPLATVLSDCLIKSAWMNVSMCDKARVTIHFKPKNEHLSLFSVCSETLYSACCQALDTLSHKLTGRVR